MLIYARALRLSIITGILVLAASSLSAGTFLVTLNNGNTFESRYQPKAASWSDDHVMILNGLGNWVSLVRSDIASIESEAEQRGYGKVIDTTTLELGWAPNDIAVPGQKSDQGELSEEGEAPIDYSVPTYAEPSAAGTVGGLPITGGGSRSYVNLPTGTATADGGQYGEPSIAE